MISGLSTGLVPYVAEMADEFVVGAEYAVKSILFAHEPPRDFYSIGLRRPRRHVENGGVGGCMRSVSHIRLNSCGQRTCDDFGRLRVADDLQRIERLLRDRNDLGHELARVFFANLLACKIESLCETLEPDGAEST